MVGIFSEAIRDNIFRARERIAEAARRSGRSPADVVLMGVSKFQPLAALYAAIDCGVTTLGESRVQEAEEKRLAWAGGRAVWHMIGHLQRNKARKALALFDHIDSVDNAELALTLERILNETPRAAPFPIFIEVNTSGEETKHGVPPGETAALFDTILKRCAFLSIEGLMTIGPMTSDERAVRTSFAMLRELRLSLRERAGLALPHLSMGMSGDYEWAIEEGSTLVRIGTGLFGSRTGR